MTKTKPPSVSLPEPTFGLDDLINALSASADSDNEGWFSARDLQNVLGLGHEAVLARLHKLNYAGRLEVKKGRRPNINGTLALSTLYRLKT